jgi:hypothetical protein
MNRKLIIIIVPIVLVLIAGLILFEQNPSLVKQQNENNRMDPASIEIKKPGTTTEITMRALAIERETSFGNCLLNGKEKEELGD